MPRRPAAPAGAAPPVARQRLDKWLVYARAVKSRSLARALIASGAVRVNSERTTNADCAIIAGDVLTMVLHERLKVWRILATAERRGPAHEAAGLYEDISPALEPGAARAPASGFAARPDGAGRPTKKQRRDTDRLRPDIEDG